MEDTEAEIVNENAVILIEDGNNLTISTKCNDPEVLFLNKDNFLPLIKSVKSLARNLVADVHTEEGYKARKAMNAKLAKLKNAIEDEGKKVAANLKSKPKMVDATRKVLNDTFEMLQDEVMAPIRAIEARKSEINDIIEMPKYAIGCNSIGCQSVINDIKSHEHDMDYWDESYAEAMNAIDDAIRQVEGIKAVAEKQEAEKAELERLRLQQAEFEKAAREKAEAEKRAVEEELAKARAEAEKAKAEAEKAKAEAEIANKKAIEAEALTKVDMGEKDSANTKDQMLFHDDAKEYKRMVNREVLEDLQRYGISEDVAKKLITDIVHGKVRHVRVIY